MMKPMPLCPGPRPPYLENEVHCLKTRTGALEERASAADARMDAAEAVAASAARLASEAVGAAAAAAAGASVQRLVSPWLATLSLRSADLAASKAWLDSRDWGPSAGACSVHVRSASSVRRWFDWRRDLASEFAVHVSGKYDSVHPHAVAGMSSMGMLCPAGSNPPPELVAFVPHMMVDGVNEAGVFAEVNVVPLKPDGSTGWPGDVCPSAAAVYECLARFGTAAEAAAWIAASVYVPRKFAAATGFSVHFMLADASGAVWTVEDGVAREVSGDGDDAPCMANFRLYSPDGARTSGTAASVAPYDPLGSGVERYAALKAGTYSGASDLYFSAAYASPSPRPSEFTGLVRADGTPVTLANLSEAATAAAVAAAVEGYDPDDDSGKWWHTAHFAEYDLEARIFSVRVREGGQTWNFGMFEKAAESVAGGGGVQSDWSETDPTSPAYVKNKPSEFAPEAHASSHASSGGDPLSPSAIGAVAAVGGTSTDQTLVATAAGLVMSQTSPSAPARDGVYVLDKPAMVTVVGGGTAAGWATSAGTVDVIDQSVAGVFFAEGVVVFKPMGSVAVFPVPSPSAADPRPWTVTVAGATLVVSDAAAGSVAASQVVDAVAKASAAQPRVPGKGLSSNDYTDAEKTKLSGVEAGAQKNVKPDWNAAPGFDAEVLNKPVPVAPRATARAGSFADAVLTALHFDKYLPVAGGGVTGPLAVHGPLTTSPVITATVAGVERSFAVALRIEQPGTLSRFTTVYAESGRDIRSDSAVTLEFETLVRNGGTILTGTANVFSGSQSMYGQGRPSDFSVGRDYPTADFTADFEDGTTLSFAAAPAVPYAKATDIVNSDWNETSPASPAFIENKPTSFAPSAHKNSHKTGGSDAITPSDIGALPSSAEDIDGYVMAFGGAQYALQTPYTQSGISGWGTADGTWKLFVAADGTVLLLKDGVAKPTNPLSVAGIPLPWSLQFNDGGLVTAVFASAGTTSTEEIVGHLRSRENPHGVTAAQIGAATTDDIPTALSQLSGDTTHRTVTDADKTAWNGKQSALTQTQLNAVNSNITAALVAWLLAFKGADTATTLASLVSQIGGKLGATNPVIWGTLSFDTTVNLLYNATSGNLATHNSGEDAPRDLAHTDELEYNAANDDTRPEGLAQPRSVSTYKVVAGTSLTITLPGVTDSDKYVSNLDLVIDTIGVTTLPAITIQPATGGKIYAVNGTMPELKADCINVIDATSIPGMNAWMVIGASELKEVTA